MKNEGAEEEEEEPFDTLSWRKDVGAIAERERGPCPDRDRWCDHRPNTFAHRSAGSIFAQVRNTFYCQLVISLPEWIAVAHSSFSGHLYSRRLLIYRRPSRSVEPTRSLLSLSTVRMFSRHSGTIQWIDRLARFISLYLQCSRVCPNSFPSQSFAFPRYSSVSLVELALLLLGFSSTIGRTADESLCRWMGKALIYSCPGAELLHYIVLSVPSAIVVVAFYLNVSCLPARFFVLFFFFFSLSSSFQRDAAHVSNPLRMS